MSAKTPQELAIEIMTLQIGLLGYYRELTRSLPINKMLMILTVEKINEIKALAESIDELEKELESKITKAKKDLK